MRSKNHPPKATFESVWATIQESSKSTQENNKFLQEMKEDTKAMKESTRITSECVEAFCRSMDNTIKDLRKSTKAMQKELGGVGNSNGKVAESYFVNSFTKSMEFAGQKYDSMDSGLKRRIKSLNLQGEYDLLLYNCTSVVIIEIKYSAEKKHIGWLLKEAALFKQLFPQYANFDLYLGLAALHFEEGTEKEAISNGIAIIKQIGENMVIYDEHLKKY